MYCNGACCFCSLPCNKSQNTEKSEKLTRTSKKLTKDSKEITVVDKCVTYEVSRNVFGKEKVRRLKNE